MTPPDLARLEALERAAQPAPWHACQDEDWGWNVAPGMHGEGASFIATIDGIGDTMEANAQLIAALRNAAPWFIAQAREAERLREEARSNTDYFAAYVRRAETAETRLAEVERERDRLSLKNEQYQTQLDDKWAGVVGVTNDAVARIQTLTAALVPLASEAQRYTDPEDRYLKRLADEAQAALDQARGGGV